MPNRLAAATSPYLLQHQDNPVDWWEWSDEAFAEATRRGVPVLLSVGYSACHWCHVMAHESFEDPDTAAEMNRMFVNIKVDREERPDVDSIYMEAVQAMTGRGGWPMTVWMTPDGRPFYAGTYFPKDRHGGMSSFGEVMRAISDAWSTDRDNIDEQADKLVEAISHDIPGGDLPDQKQLDRSIKNILNELDSTFGGFGGAPKFPQQPTLEFLLRSRHTNQAIDNALELTLTRMADGGIHDHLGGGFARYSVDRTWLVPHFEKMLYDNAQLARIYLWAGVELGSSRFLEVMATTLEYLVTDLRHDEGGFFSAEDADSEGVEGKFYVWDYAEFVAVLESEAVAMADYFGVSKGGNFEGQNILNLMGKSDAPPSLSKSKEKLLGHRNRRVRPGLDDKVVAAWNGLTIRALAEAGAALGVSRYIEVAESAADFALANLKSGSVLMRSWRNGRTSVPGFVDDYAGMALGLYALFQATGAVKWFNEAEKLVARLSDFEKPEGGFYTTSTDADGLIKRPSDITDSPLPSGNSLAAESLLISSLLNGDLAKRDRSIAALANAGALADRYPTMIGHHLAVAHSIVSGTKEVAVVGENREDLVSEYWSRFRPHTVLAQATEPNSSVPLLADRFAPEAGALAYVCEGFVCNLPTSAPTELAEQLGAT